MKPIKFILLTGVAGFAAGLVYYWRDSVKTVELIPGEKYLVTAIGSDPDILDGSNGQKIRKELEKMIPQGFKLTQASKEQPGTGTFILKYTMAPKNQFVKVQLGKPLFQVESVQFITKSVKKL